MAAADVGRVILGVLIIVFILLTFFLFLYGGITWQWWILGLGVVSLFITLCLSAFANNTE